jgi:hypothetical protein
MNRLNYIMLLLAILMIPNVVHAEKIVVEQTVRFILKQPLVWLLAITYYRFTKVLRLT